MAGKKGMKHARPRTQEERDIYALSRIEHIYDSVTDKVITCPECGKDHELKIDAVQAKMLADRYRTLRPVLASSELSVKTSTYAEDILKLQLADRAANTQRLHSDSTDKPVTH